MFNCKSFSIASAIFGLGLSSSVFIQLPAQADVCTAFRVIGGQGTEVRKRIDGRPGGAVKSNNWNTDFVVPGGVRYDYYSIITTAENAAEYDVSVHFKYANNTSDTLFQNGRVLLDRGKPWILNLQSPTGRQPYQVNLRIGGKNGNVYRAKVAGCRVR
jgi:hypothetical protein